MWIQWPKNHGRNVSGAQKMDSAFIVQAVSVQSHRGGCVLVESSAAAFAHSVSAPSLSSWLEKWSPSTLCYWCGLKITMRSGSGLLCGRHQVHAIPQWEASECICGRHVYSSYASTADVGYEQFCKLILVKYGLVEAGKTIPLPLEWHTGQRKLRTSAGAREFVTEVLSHPSSRDSGSDLLGTERVLTARRDVDDGRTATKGGDGRKQPGTLPELSAC